MISFFITEETKDFRDGLPEDFDFVIVSKEALNKLCEWFSHIPKKDFNLPQGQNLVKNCPHNSNFSFN